MFQLAHLQFIKERIEEPRKFIQVVLGPRQVDKTTMITHVLSQLTVPSLYESAETVHSSNAIKLSQI